MLDMIIYAVNELLLFIRGRYFHQNSQALEYIRHQIRSRDVHQVQTHFDEVNQNPYLSKHNRCIRYTKIFLPTCRIFNRSPRTAKVLSGVFY